MKRLTSKGLFGILVLGLMIFVGMSTDAMGQGRGRGRGLDKKCDKFVNCHDARDGRLDGRGPNRDRDNRFGNIFRRSRRDRDRDRDRWERRRRHRDRDSDGTRWRRWQ